MIPTVIHTQRVTLRPWSLADAADVFAYAVDEEWARYLPVPQPYREDDARVFVEMHLAFDPAEETAWAIELEGRAVGGINLRSFHGGLVGEIDYAIARPCWGRGLGTEVVGAVVDSAFGAMPGLARVRSSIDPRNVASARVLEKAGLRCEGVLRSNTLLRAVLVDEAWYGILRGDWTSLVRRASR
jgi:ribosomal-protein-alanine N-acetyltransferase